VGTQELIERAKAFVAAVAAAEPRATIEAFYADDIMQNEFPNLLLPNGAVRDFINLRTAYDKSRHAIAAQSCDVVNAAQAIAWRWRRYGPRRWRSGLATVRPATPSGRGLRNSSNSATA
jgi:hypothetical protein